MSKIKSIFFEDVSLNESIISSSRSSNLIELKNISSSICFFDIFFKISLHLFVWLIKRSMSLETSLLSPISFLSSLATTAIVASGVPSE